MNLYRVTVLEETDKNTENLDRETYTVVSANAEAAIARVRREVVGRSWRWDDDNGKQRTSKTTAITVLGVQMIATVDFK